jgi:hypothetical protein
LALGIGADDPDFPFLHFAQGAREIGDRDVGDRLGSAAGDLHGRLRQADGAILGRDDRVRADGVGDAQAGAEVVRILNAVEDEQERPVRRACRERRRASRGAASRRPWRSLPGAGRRAPSLQARAVYRQHAHRGELGVPNQVTQASIVATGVDVDLAYCAGVVAQFGERRMEAENQA